MTGDPTQYGLHPTQLLAKLCDYLVLNLVSKGKKSLNAFRSGFEGVMQYVE